MPQKSKARIAVIGIDIGKNSFHVVGLDKRGAIVLRQRWSRGQVETRLANVASCPDWDGSFLRSPSPHRLKNFSAVLLPRSPRSLPLASSLTLTGTLMLRPNSIRASLRSCSMTTYL